MELLVSIGAILFLTNVIVVKGLAEYSPKEVLDLVNQTCLVLMKEPVVDSLSVEFFKEMAQKLAKTNIPFGFVDFEDLQNQNRLILSIDKLGKIDNSGIFVLDRKQQDRTCLLRSALTLTKLNGEVFGESLNENSLLKLINKRCLSYWDKNGELLRSGRVRNEILANLQTSAQLTGSKAVDIKSLVKRCGGNLKEFFYSGTCSGSQFCDQSNCSHSEVQLPKCDVFDETPRDFGKFFDKFLSKSRPVVFKGLAKRWKAYYKWSNDFFRQKFGENSVHVKLAPPNSDFEGVESLNLWQHSNGVDIPKEVAQQLHHPDLVMVRPKGVEMRTNEFLDIIENKSNLSGKVAAYIQYTSIAGYIRELEEDLSEFDFVENVLKLSHLNFWLSEGNTLGKLHFDQFDNFLAQLRGRKQLIIFDPLNNQRFEEGHIREAMFRFRNGQFYRERLLDSTAMTMSPIDIVAPNLQRFPEFGAAVPLNCTISAGDVLYLPSFWWHEVQSYPDQEESRNLAVNFWYEPFLTKEFPCAECGMDVNPTYRHLL